MPKFIAPAPVLKDPADTVEVRKAFAVVEKWANASGVGEEQGSDAERGQFYKFSDGLTAQEAAAAGTIPIRDENGNLPGALQGMPKDPTGFSAPDQVGVSYDSTTTRITLSGTVAAYWKGVRVPDLVAGWVSPALTTFYASPATTYFLYFNGTEFLWSSTPWTFDMLQIATVTYTGAGGYLFALRECHGVMQYQAHDIIHRNIGTFRKSGGTISAVVTGSTTAADRRPAVAATVVSDEDLDTTNAALSAGSYTHHYLSGAGAANTFALAAGDIVPLSGTRPYFNEYTGGAWAQTLINNNNYMAVWLVAIPTTADTGAQAYRYIWIQGQSEGTLASQQALTPANLTLGTLVNLAPEFVFVARLILRYTASDWNIAQVDMISSGRYLQVTAAPSITVPVITATTGNFTDLNVTNPIAGSVTGNAGTVTTANEATDTTCYPLFAPAASGSQEPKTNANFTFDSAAAVMGLLGLTLTAGGTVGNIYAGALSSSVLTSSNANQSFGTATVYYVRVMNIVVVFASFFLISSSGTLNGSVRLTPPANIAPSSGLSTSLTPGHVWRAAAAITSDNEAVKYNAGGYIETIGTLDSIASPGLKYGAWWAYTM